MEQNQIDYYNISDTVPDSDIGKTFHDQNGRKFRYVRSQDAQNLPKGAVVNKVTTEGPGVKKPPLETSGQSSTQVDNRVRRTINGEIVETKGIYTNKKFKPGTQGKKVPRKPKKGGMGWFGTSLALFNFGSTYFDQRAEGESRLGSLAYASKELILPEFLGWKTHMALGLAPALAKGVVSGLEGLAQTGREYERAARDQRPFRNNTFVDSQQIYTMRQAGLALAEQSKYSLQQTLIGNEAEYMHR